MFIISIKRIRGMSLIWLCVVVALQGCASAPVADWQFVEYEKKTTCNLAGCIGHTADACDVCRDEYFLTGHVLRLEQVKE